MILTQDVTSNMNFNKITNLNTLENISGEVTEITLVRFLSVVLFDRSEVEALIKGKVNLKYFEIYVRLQ